MKAQPGASCVFAKGAAATKITAEPATTTSASRRSRLPAGSVDTKIGRSSVSSRAMQLPSCRSSCRQAAAFEQRPHLACGHGTREVITLRLAAAVRLEKFELLDRLHALSGHVEHQLLRDRDDRADDRRV